MPASQISSYTQQFKIQISHTPSRKSVEFGMFLTSFNDSYKPNFKSTQVYGRMDPIVNFQNTSRVITIAFVVPAESEEVARNNLRDLSDLAKFQYPEYTKADRVSGIQNSPICTMKVHNLVSEGGEPLYGYFSGFDFSPVNESGYFIDDDNFLFPKEYKVSLTFNVLHTKPVGWLNNTWLNNQGILSSTRPKQIGSLLLTIEAPDAAGAAPVEQDGVDSVVVQAAQDIMSDVV